MKWLIGLLTAATGILHLLVGFHIIGPDGTTSWLLVLNGVGYLVLLWLFWTSDGSRRGTIRWLLLAYTLITLVGYFLINGSGGFQFTLGLIIKAIELLLIILLFLDRGRDQVAVVPASTATPARSGAVVSSEAYQAASGFGTASSAAAIGAVSAVKRAEAEADAAIEQGAVDTSAWGERAAADVDLGLGRATTAVDMDIEEADYALEEIVEEGDEVIEETGEGVGGWLDRAGDRVGDAVDDTGDALAGAGAAVGAAVGGAVAWLGDKADDAADATGEAMDDAGDWAGDKVDDLHLAAKIVDTMPQATLTPETTSGRQGFVHLVQMSGTAAAADLQFILRDFEREGLAAQADLLRKVCAAVAAGEPRAHITCEVTAQYRNMRYWLEDDMRPVELAMEACRQVGVEPFSMPIRGGTDGSRLTELGVPTPNVFTGMQEIPGPLEWVSVQDMGRATEVCIKLAQLWAAN